MGKGLKPLVTANYEQTNHNIFVKAGLYFIAKEYREIFESAALRHFQKFLWVL